MMFPKIVTFCNHTFITSLLGSDSYVIDLGANRGEFSQAMVKRYRCRVYACEPVPEYYDQIKESERCKKYAYGISRKNGPMSLIRPDDLCPSLYHSNETKKDTTVFATGVVYNSFLKEIKLSTIDLLKVDIEGAEIDLFNSMSVADVMAHTQITVEFHDFLFPQLNERVEQIKGKIGDSGFYQIPFSLDNSDILFVRKDALSFAGYLYLRYFMRFYRKRERILSRIRHTFARSG